MAKGKKNNGPEFDNEQCDRETKKLLLIMVFLVIFVVVFKLLINYIL